MGDWDRLREQQQANSGLGGTAGHGVGARPTPSIFSRVSNNKAVVRAVLKIAGALGGLDRRCSNVVLQLSRFDFLWQVCVGVCPCARAGEGSGTAVPLHAVVQLVQCSTASGRLLAWMCTANLCARIV